ncbi:CPBP family intramembrane glutamic endopeptidase [Desulfatibacillum aliphaticivorans]|uniref:Abortive infection protein n=1 Tax=Desulfatibacillum aliphaticivorans TaxID=218208 RepID=B8FHI4_DESAL|nr:type II CAAX endopeptidase family protein [Desulfatibacillum aliphaticivorans]ACL02272.1 Abortive infection protein [Desulfatibacillum aliphaticivorans]
MKKLNLQVYRPKAQEPAWLCVLEIFVVLCIVLFPAVQRSLLVFLFPEKFTTQPFVWFAGNTLIGLIWATIPVLYIMWRSPYSFRDFGLDRFRFPRDVGEGILSVIAMWGSLFIVLFVVMMFVMALGFQPPNAEGSPIMKLITGPSGWPEYVLMVVLALGVGFSEELVMRGYLMTKLQMIKDNAWFCIIVSSLIFGVGHIYQGLWAVLGTALIGAAFGTIFWFRRRIWPLAVAHALHDIMALSVTSYVQHLK